MRTERTRWLFTERQGSIETAYVVGEAPQHFRYDSFGGVLDDAGEVTGDAPDASVSHGYTGHEHDAELGLINMNGRGYHPRLRRFLSADPITTGVNQGLNRYAYVRNSPSNLVDPSGFQTEGSGRDLADPRISEIELGVTAECSASTLECEDMSGWSFSTPSDGASDRAGGALIGDAVMDGAENALLSSIDRMGLTDPVNLAAGAPALVPGNPFRLPGHRARETVFPGARGLRHPRAPRQTSPPNAERTSDRGASRRTGFLLATPAGPAILASALVLGGIYVATHCDEVSTAFMRPYHTIAAGEATPATYFEAMFAPGTAFGGAVAGPAASASGAALAEFLLPASEASATTVLESVVATGVSGGSGSAGLAGSRDGGEHRR